MFIREINRPAYGCRSYGDIRYSDAYIVIISYPRAERGIKLKFYNTEGIKQGEIGDDIQQGMILNINFDLMEFGCGKFNLLLTRKPGFIIKYRTRMDIHLFNDDNPWFSGYVMELPIEGTTEIEYKYGGFGFYFQLETCIVDKKYTNTEISAIVDDIIQTFVEPKTDIVYDSNKIENTGYTVNEIEFNKVSAKKALSDLMEMAQNFVMGVEEDRKFFFRAISTDINVDAIRAVGKHFKAYILQKDTSKILNKIYILAGKITTGSNYICTVENSESQTTYGKREGTLIIPSSLNLSDAERWGNYRLSKLKDPIEKARVQDIDLQQKIIKAVGKARIFGKPGTLPSIEKIILDLMEYPDNTAAQAAYVSSDSTPGYSSDLIPTMTGPSAPSGVASASTKTAGLEAWKAMDDAGGRWRAAFGVVTGWLAYEFAATEIITKCTLTMTEAEPTAMPKDWTFEGWTGSVWDVLDTQTNESGWVKDETRSYTFSNTTAYIKYRINISANNGHADRLTIGEFEMMETIINLQCYSESTIKQQGSYSLKIVAQQTGSLNDTLTKTLVGEDKINLSGKKTIKFDARALRTGQNFQVQLHDSGGNTITIDVNITSSITWQKIEKDISGVTDTNKDDIDKIIIKIIDAGADNEIYIDNMFTQVTKYYKELYIKRVNYKISSQGIRCDMELGKLYLPMTEEILNLLRDLKNEKELQQANIKQLSV